MGVATVIAVAACSSPSTQRVTGKQECTKDDKPAYCLTVAGGHTFYVPLVVYRQAQPGDGYDPGSDSVRPPAPDDEQPPGGGNDNENAPPGGGDDDPVHVNPPAEG
jgi:hypothetical protein